MFGSSNTGSGFGSSFGASNNNVSNSSGSLFGSKPAASSTNGGFSFGNNQQTNNNPSNNTPSPFGGAAKIANTSSGGLFGSSNNNAVGSSGGLFGNSTNANPSPNTGLFGNNQQSNSPGSGLFGNNNNQQQSSQASGGLFGNKPTAPSGGLFGSTSSTTNNSAPAGGLFGNSSSTTNANSTGGGLFGNNNIANNTSTTGGLFGNNANTSNTNSTLPGSFGNTSSGGLFGNTSNSSSATKPSLFGSSNQSSNTQGGGLFGGSNNVNSTSTNSLFGNNANTNQTINTTPMKQYNFKDLPKSITESGKPHKTVSTSTISRKRSLSSSSSSSIPTVSSLRSSSLLDRLGSRFSTLKSSVTYNSEGLFSPRKDTAQTALALDKPKDTTQLQFKSFPGSSFNSKSVNNSRVSSSDWLKLKPDPSRTEARRLKIFGKSGNAHKVRILGQEEPEVLSISHEADNVNGGEDHIQGSDFEQHNNNQNGLADQQNGEQAEEKDSAVEETDYWCSPSIQELQQLQLRQLADIPDFTIGRKGYGVINFELPVDLTAFWSDLPGYLFGNVVKFNKNKTVEVYPYESVPLGTGLNVPATITLEKVFPVTKSKKPETDSVAKDLQYRLFVKKLKELKGMEFVTYDPINGSWTFRVKHFSIWGLVDEEEAAINLEEELKKIQEKAKKSETDSNSANASSHSLKSIDTPPIPKKIQKTNTAEDNFIFKRKTFNDSYEMDTTLNMPGSFIIDNPQVNNAPQVEKQVIGLNNVLGDMDMDGEDEEEDSIIEDEIPYELGLRGDESFAGDNFDDDVLEKQFEPTNIDEEDFAIIDADPALAVSDDWDDQLALSARFDSAYVDDLSSKNVSRGLFSRGMSPGDLDKLLYGDFAKVLKSQKKIEKELRMQKYNFTNFTTSDQIIVKTKRTASHVASKSIHGFYGTESKAFLQAVYKKHMSLSKIITRKNGFPLVSKNNQLSFDFICQISKNDFLQDEISVWNLASILFDSYDDGELRNVDDAEVINRVNDIKRRESLVAWVKKLTQVELDSKIDSCTDTFEQIALLLVSFNIPDAAKLAIKTNNPHLSVLISLLGSNDPDVKQSAASQIQEWKKNAVLQTIPKGLLKIYYLLKGDVLSSDSIVDLTKDLSWKSKLGMILTYGDLNQSLGNLLESFINSQSAGIPKKDSPFFNLLKLYVFKHDSRYNISEIFSSFKTKKLFDVRLQWYIYEVLVRSSGQLTFGLHSEVGDKLTLLFAEQLQMCDLWEEALFILAHINDDFTCERTITQLVNSKIELFSKGDLEYKLSDILKVPSKLIYESKALYYRFTGHIWAEAESLLDAERYDEAHRVIVTKCGPAAIINNGSKLKELSQLIARFPEQLHIKDWAIGLAVYKNYLNFLKNKSESTLRFLVEHIPLVRIINFKVKVAIRLMSREIAHALIVYAQKEGNSFMDLNVSKISELPLGECESRAMKRHVATQNLKQKMVA